ncbi:MAG: OmpA family protein, partial [Candidatus Margulisbacteria bacterium]|nr:OmpA family protein [Candidatus Margulisiibacteriota bacterium]
YFTDNFYVPQEVNIKEKKFNIPLTKAEVNAKFIVKNINFDTGKTDIRPEAIEPLNKAADLLNKNQKIQLEISGHTDNRGNINYNKNLALKRAESVKNYLVNRGISADRLTAIGYGPDKPIASNATEAGRQENRRIEFFITKITEGNNNE